MTENWENETMQQEQNSLYESKMPKSEKRKKKKPGFLTGVLVGVLASVAVVIILAVAGAVMFYNLTAQKVAETEDGKTVAFDSVLGDSDTDTTQAEGEDGAVEQPLLNVDLLSQVSMIDSYLEEDYLYDVDNEALREGMLQGMLQALDDPYSEYYNEEELASFNDSTEGEYVGIGAAVTQEISTGIVRISKPYEGTPSAEAGLLPGDIIVSVDGTEVTGMDLNQVVSLIKGEEGTTVTLNIYREEEESYTDIPVERRQVEIPTVISEMLEKNTGYIEVTSFDGVTAKQFISAYEELKAQGMERVIVDMRNNGGGLVDTVEAMLDYLLPEGTIFYVQDKHGEKSLEYISDASAALDIPMVILVNENTASAAEIFSGNIQAFGLGKVVGTTTYGKGVMQRMYYTNSQQTAAVKLTVADYYINGDKNINGTGITPDVEVELNEEAAKMLEIPVEQDNQLQEALKLLDNMKGISQQ